MNTVVLVGAGATLAESLPSRPPKSRRPPLDATFFELCRLAKLDGRLVLRRYMGERYGIDPFSTAPRMEEVFNFIYSDAFPGTPPPGCLDAYWVLLNMYREAIARTTNSLNGASRYGAGGLLRFLLRDNPERVLTFVTFNHDLVIEKALQAAATTRRFGWMPWNFWQAYRINFRTFRNYTSRSEPFATGGDSSISVLKLHGSLNWVYPVRSGGDPRNSIRTPSGNLHCLNEQVLRPGRPKMTTEKSPRNYELVSLIVPPIYEKAARYQAVLKPLWEQARAALEAADELFVFGYSFPEADVAARSMLRQAYVKNSHLRDVHIVDIDSGVAARISDLLGARCTYHYKTVPDLVEHYR